MIPRQKMHAQGPEFSRLVCGTWRVLDSEDSNTPEKLARVIAACLDLGITTFDLADIYGGYRAEALFGSALGQLKIARSQIELVSKCDILIQDRAKLNGVDPSRYGIKHYDTSAAYLHRAVEESLKALETDYLDLLLIHRPDPLMDADETARGLQDLVAGGKVKHLGVSNHSPSQFALLQARLGLPLVTNQIECSVLQPKALYDGTLDQAQMLRAAPMIWSPLGGGALFSGSELQQVRVRGVLARLASELGAAEIAQVALAWLLAHPARLVPVLGTARLDRLKSYVNSVNLRLDRVAWFEILEACQGQEVP
jgi:predicted oxidoreductase